MKRPRPFVALILLAGCTSALSLQPPIPANTFIDSDRAEAFSITMVALSNLNYRITNSDSGAGFVRAIANDGLLYEIAVTVVVLEAKDGTSIKITPQAGRSNETATKAARSVRVEIDRLAAERTD